jgi:hypothetical protein
MTDATVEARLQCFEEATASLEQATDSGEVVVVDRAQIRESRRRLFGISLPRCRCSGAATTKPTMSIQSTEWSPRLRRMARGTGSSASRTARSGGRSTGRRSRCGPARPGRGHQPRRARQFMMKVNGQQAIRVKREL